MPPGSARPGCGREGSPDSGGALHGRGSASRQKGKLTNVHSEAALPASKRRQAHEAAAAQLLVVLVLAGRRGRKQWQRRQQQQHAAWLWRGAAGLGRAGRAS